MMGNGDELIVEEGKTRCPRDWKKCLSNDESKQQLLLSTWCSESFSQKLDSHGLILICDGIIHFQMGQIVNLAVIMMMAIDI